MGDEKKKILVQWNCKQAGIPIHTHTHTRLYKAKVIGSDLVMLALGKSEYFFFCVLTGK